MSSLLNIHTIAHNQEENLRSSVIDGLTAVLPKTLPHVLLWDDVGHELFQKITNAEYYHGPEADREIMRARVDEICELLGDDGVLVELAAGSIPHTSLILEELCRKGTKTRYLAHDFSQNSLAQSLCRLENELGSKYPDSPRRMSGIAGTYEEFFDWVSKTDELRGRRVVVIWLGNSLSHVSDTDFRHMISVLMHSISLSQPASSVLLLSANSSQGTEALRSLYDSPDGSCSAFVANALVHANRLLGTNDALDAAVWQPVFTVNPESTSVSWSFRSREETRLTVDGKPVPCAAGEEIALVTLSARDETRVTGLLAPSSAAQLVGTWKHPSRFQWSWFVIINRADSVHGHPFLQGVART
ncbi:hypothetical protein F4778DRAFT_788852 [Xylariomycetidae sp. FL2044]|nr:hypothetical protein F4778DRAFT_788852 [Xylariomycetidae sp. FL2044]